MYCLLFPTKSCVPQFISDMHVLIFLKAVQYPEHESTYPRIETRFQWNGKVGYEC